MAVARALPRVSVLRCPVRLAPVRVAENQTGRKNNDVAPLQEQQHIALGGCRLRDDECKRKMLEANEKKPIQSLQLWSHLFL